MTNKIMGLISIALSEPLVLRPRKDNLQINNKHLFNTRKKERARS